LFVRQETPVKIAYAYRYQHSDGAMIFRYDNAPHFPNLPTAPHPKHTSETNVIAANAPDFETVIREFENLIALK
jgi:hypothetical protein